MATRAKWAVITGIIVPIVAAVLARWRSVWLARSTIVSWRSLPWIACPVPK